MSKATVRAIGLYSAVIGIAYIVYGLIEIVAWAIGPLSQIPLSPSQDAFAGFSLLVIGSVLVYGVKALLDMRYEGLSFLLVGLILSAILGVMYILIAGADALDALIVGEAWEFDSSAYNLPAIAFFILLLPSWLAMRYRDEFSS